VLALRCTADVVDRGEITLKPYGKQTIFVYNQVCQPSRPSPDLTGADKQDKLPVMSAEDMATLDEELKSAQDSLKEQREQLKELERSELLGYL
jgi:26S proteasome regulatory subunit (ATPase 3-interacting protein)